jgi:NAD-dependent deacetylase
MGDTKDEASRYIEEADRIVAFTGAGVSAESGIPTFRGETGLWKEYDPRIYADIDYFRKDPTYYWSFFRDVRVQSLVGSKPNLAHLAIAHLERQNKLQAVITQNIDGLHQAAGNTNVIELHGNTRVIGCFQCEADFDFEEVRQQLLDEMPPLCRYCGGVLKPRVVFFGEPLPQGAMAQAASHASQCDLFLVVGSTLTVFPAASLPVIAKRSGARIAIINLGPTAMDEIADVRIDAKAGEVLPAIVGLDSTRLDPQRQGGLKNAS